MTAARRPEAPEMAQVGWAGRMELDVHARPQEVASARHAVADFLRSRAVPSTVVEDLELVTSELVTNAVLHPAPSTHPIHVSVDAGSTVIIEVANHGTISHIPAIEDWRPAQPTELSGRGLGIVRRLSDEVDVREDGDWAVVVSRRHLPGRDTPL